MTFLHSKDCKRQLDSHCHCKGDVWLVSDLCRYYSLCFYISIILIILLQALKWSLQQRMYLPCKVLSWHADWRVLISWMFHCFYEHRLARLHHLNIYNIESLCVLTVLRVLASIHGLVKGWAKSLAYDQLAKMRADALDQSHPQKHFGIAGPGYSVHHHLPAPSALLLSASGYRVYRAFIKRQSLKLQKKWTALQRLNDWCFQISVFR